MSELTPRSKKAEEKAELKKKKQYQEALDEKDESFCGQISLMVIDEDGYQRKLKGNSVEAALHIEHVSSHVRLTAFFSPQNPLFYLEFKNESNHFLFGQLWFGGDKVSKTNEIGRILPKPFDQVHKELSDNNGKAVAKLEIPFLTKMGERLADVELTTVEKRFKVTLQSVAISIPIESWMEMKKYRVQFWSQNKLWEAFKKPIEEEKEKDEEKKDE